VGQDVSSGKCIKILYLSTHVITILPSSKHQQIIQKGTRVHCYRVQLCTVPSNEAPSSQRISGGGGIEAARKIRQIGDVDVYHDNFTFFNFSGAVNFW
jgi:hypothetical protein